MEKLKNALWLAVFAVGTLAFICFGEGIKITGKNMSMVGLGMLMVAGIVCGMAAIASWAGNAKEEHERRVKDGSLDYRFSQAKYVVALIILGLFALVLAYAFLHGLFVPGAGS